MPTKVTRIKATPINSTPTAPEGGIIKLAPATQHGFSVNEARCHETEVQRQDCLDRGYTLGAVIRAGRSPITIRRGEVQARKINRTTTIAKLVNDIGHTRCIVKIIDRRKYPHLNMTSELKALHRVRGHPNVVHVYEYFETKDFMYLVLEHCGAGTLHSYICTKQNSGLGLPENEARRLFVDLCYAFSHCHQQGVVHRNLKCHSVLLDHDKITNEVIVKLSEFHHADVVEEPTNRTSTVIGLPTYAYAPPELFLENRFDGKLADIWSMGVVLFYLLNGRLPYGNEPAEKLVEIKQQKFSAPIRGNMSREAQTLLKQILQFRPLDRININDMLHDRWTIGETAGFNAFALLEAEEEEFATEVGPDVASNDQSGEPSILATTAREANMDSRMSPSLQMSDNKLGSKRGSSGKSGTIPRMSMAKRLSLAAARRESHALPVRYSNFRIYAFSPTSDSETGFRQSYAREHHRASLPQTFQKKRTSIRPDEKRTSIRPDGDTTSLTMDWPELQRSSHTQLPVQHVYIWESTDDVQTSHKSAPKSRLGKTANTLVPRRDQLRNISMRGQNRGGSAKNTVLNNGARQNRYRVSTVATEVCHTPEYSMEFDVMRHRDSTFEHAERMLDSTSTAQHTPPSPRYHHTNQYLNEESMRHLSTALNDYERKKTTNHEGTLSPHDSNPATTALASRTIRPGIGYKDAFNQQEEAYTMDHDVYDFQPGEHRDWGGHDVGDTKGSRHRPSIESHILVDIATTLGSTARNIRTQQSRQCRPPTGRSTTAPRTAPGNAFAVGGSSPKKKGLRQAGHYDAFARQSTTKTELHPESREYHTTRRDPRILYYDRGSQPRQLVRNDEDSHENDTKTSIPGKADHSTSHGIVQARRGSIATDSYVVAGQNQYTRRPNVDASLSGAITYESKEKRGTNTIYDGRVAGLIKPEPLTDMQSRRRRNSEACNVITAIHGDLGAFDTATAEQKPPKQSESGFVEFIDTSGDECSLELQQVRQVVKSVHLKQEALKKQLQRRQSLPPDQLSESGRQHLSQLQKSLHQLDQNEQGLMQQEQYLSRRNNKLRDVHGQQQQGGRRLSLAHQRDEAKQVETVDPLGALRKMNSDELYQHLAQLVSQLERLSKQFQLKHKSGPGLLRQIQERRQQIAELIALLVARLRPQLAVPQLCLITQQRVHELLRHLGTAVAREDPPQQLATQQVVHEVEQQLMHTLGVMHAQHRQEQLQYNVDYCVKLQHRMYQLRHEISVLMQQEEVLIAEQSQKPERLRKRSKKHDPVQHMQVQVVQQLKHLMHHYDHLLQQSQLHLRMHQVFQKLERQLHEQTAHYRLEQEKSIHEVEEGILPMLQQLYQQQRSVTRNSDYKPEARVLIAHIHTALRKHHMSLHSPRGNVDNSAQTRIQREIQQMMLRAEALLLQESGEELSEEDETTQPVTEPGIRVEVTAHDSPSGDIGLHDAGGGCDMDEGLGAIIGQIVSVGTKIRQHREGNVSPSFAEDVGANDPLVTITFSGDSCDAVQSNPEIGSDSVAPNCDEMQLLSPKSPNTEILAVCAALKRGSRSYTGDVARKIRIGRSNKQQKARRRGTIQPRMDKKLKSEEPNNEDSDADSAVDIPLGRKRATIHLASDHPSLRSRKGPRNSSILSAKTLASHLSSEFSLSPMRIECGARNSIPLSVFWPKQTRSAFTAMETVDGRRPFTLPAATLAKWRVVKRRADINAIKTNRRGTKVSLFVEAAKVVMIVNKIEKLVSHAKKPKLVIVPGEFFTAPDKVTDPKKAAVAGSGTTASIAAVRRVMHPERAARSSVTEMVTGESRRPSHPHLHPEAGESSDFIMVTLAPSHIANEPKRVDTLTMPITGVS